ncbi:uncharacterized protein LOC106637255 [Copidosoma floridanum]|uniref:uncharacterized protein LOC106637255 n=1 Tax=Copidosoma floridanum TaxID=29053 RepID=UPI0006C96A08|nr:uncharacterized protein LOC106637255 [Copidosoma floridanum]
MMGDHVTCIVSFFFAGCFVLSPPPEAHGHYYDAQLHYQQPHAGWQHRYRVPAPPLIKPVDLMADVVNSLGARVLQQYVEAGNVAFSPAGLGFILAALYEGSAGRGRQQIVECLGFPRDRAIVRLGLGDIHRTLRTYLNPDGFLGGLNLNRENTSLRPEYEAVLRIYGFDLTIDLSNFGPNGTNSFGLRGSPTTTTPPTTTSTEQTPLNVGVSMSMDGVTVATTMDPSVDDSTTPAGTTVPPPTSPTRATTTTQEPMTTTTDAATTTMATTSPSTTRQPTTTNEAIGSTMVPSAAETTTGLGDDIATVAAPNLRRRRRRSTYGYYSNYPGRSLHLVEEGPWMQDLNAWADQPALPTNVQDTTELQFLVNGCEPVQVPAAIYTTVLPFAYFPTLKAVGLEFPLDNPKYSVLLFLPTERVDTSRLGRELTGQSLRLLRKHLQPTWIRATIPSFMLRGFVTLTPYLQRLGIKDVFEPRLADLSPMTPDLGVYARDVQQSVAINIRNFMRNNSDAPTGHNSEYRYLRPANGLLDRLGLVTFTAEHPFLYFIIDNETSVSLIAGRIDDPLNSRIL